MKSPLDQTIGHCPNILNWTKLVNEASLQFGNDMDMGPKVKNLLIEAGFIDVKEKKVQIPLSPWAKGRKAKDLGVVQQEQFCNAIDSYTIALFTRVLGWTAEECKVLMDAAKKEVRNPKNQLYINFVCEYLAIISIRRCFYTD